MKNALILHGVTGSPRDNWFPWLKTELEKRRFRVRSPHLPNSNNPDRYEWLNAIKENLKNWNLEETAVIAHSLGVPAILDYIESQENKLGLLVSVAGFARAYGSEYNQKYMKTKSIDLIDVRKKINKTIIIFSDNDPYVPQVVLKELAEGLDVEPVVIKGQKHFSISTMGEKYKLFPELLKYI